MKMVPRVAKCSRMEARTGNSATVKRMKTYTGIPVNVLWCVILILHEIAYFVEIAQHICDRGEHQTLTLPPQKFPCIGILLLLGNLI
jgi:hypothetical protein